MKKSTLLHLRVPFSFFLLPIFLLAVAVMRADLSLRLLSIFVIIHLLLYPASNGYNSYFDRDEGSIGGLKNPPKVRQELFWVAWIMDVVAILWGWMISWPFAVMLLIYGLVSKAYSHPRIRLKKMPITGWVAAGIFQGYFTVMMVAVAIRNEGLSVFEDWEINLGGLLSSLLLFGSYPMTQIYQHEEDASRGDRTISRLLGILGTFHFTAVLFTFSTALFCLYFAYYHSLFTAGIFFVGLIPVLLYFMRWYFLVRKNLELADYDHTMRLNAISAFCLNAVFLWIWLN